MLYHGGKFTGVHEARVPRENQRTTIEKLTNLFNEDWSRMHPHKRGSSS